MGYFVIGGEWGSFWCFSASLACVAYPFEPWVLKANHQRVQRVFEKISNTNANVAGDIHDFETRPNSLLQQAFIELSRLVRLPGQLFGMVVSESIRKATELPISPEIIGSELRSQCGE